MAKKQNKKTILIALLVVSIAVTGAFIGTLAKYVTTSTGSDAAVVAKFELDIPTTINLFSDSYTNVKADTDGKKIIAPGTTGEYTFNVTGKSEVAYRVSAAIEVVYSEEWDGYTPLKFKLNDSEWTDFAEFEADLSSALESDIIAPGNSYSSTQTIHWQWPFNVSDENDVKDTAMGKAAAGASAPNVTITIEATATQVD